MIVTFISQCEKRAIKRTRRILDSFANRIGDNAWQTIITEDGVNAVKKLLRSSASKNTAIACHWIRSRIRTELLWIVGNRNKFNQQGIVPVNSTKKKINYHELESNWTNGSTIQILATIAALLHDIGKSTCGFQNKLQSSAPISDPYRHEWISLKMFHKILDGCSTDKEWLEKLLSIDTFLKDNPKYFDNLSMDKFHTPKLLEKLPLAQIIGWLIVSHHRLPFRDIKYYETKTQKEQRNLTDIYKIHQYLARLEPIKNWVLNEYRIKDSNTKQFTIFSNNILLSKTWQKELKRWVNKIISQQSILDSANSLLNDPFVLHISRLCLMIGDHNYSSKDTRTNSDAQKLCDKNLSDKLFANTNSNKELKQKLDEHLIGVSKCTAKFANMLPTLRNKLPSISDNNNFNKKSNLKRFKWQDNSYNLVKSIHKKTVAQGFFGINMASTGCGKTLANAKIMYALNNEKDVRFTIALGLRVLTLQTGEALRNKLKLDTSEQAILIGSSTQQNLFEYNKTQKSQENSGSESLEELVPDFDIDFDGCNFDENEFGAIFTNEKNRQLLYAPIVSCTIDHIIQASENIRGGKHIIPILRLLTSDLILDEPDDFSTEDLPALSRLVYLAGIFGTRIIISSATITPDFAIGLFRAYQEGRKIWNKQIGINNNKVVCAWFDEHKQIDQICDLDTFQNQHTQFVETRAKYLQQQNTRHLAHLFDVYHLNNIKIPDKFYLELANSISKEAIKLHNLHHEYSTSLDKKASIGIVRIANIKHLVKLTQALYKLQDIDTNINFHIVCYHSRQLLILRNQLEAKLDKILDRSVKLQDGIFTHKEIINAVKKSNAHNHIFMILATPVAEVGRDHDYDWGIIEPSSMRSIIQLAGRVWRHRSNKYIADNKMSNIAIMNFNIRALMNQNIKNAFVYPGFESNENIAEFGKYLLDSHNLQDILTNEQLTINSVARILKPDNLNPKNNLAHLEHKVMEDLLNNNNDTFVNILWHNDTCFHANAHLQLISQFRYDTRRIDEQNFIYLADTDNDYIPALNDDVVFQFAYKENLQGNIESVIAENSDWHTPNHCVHQWLSCNLVTTLKEIAEYQQINSVKLSCIKYANVNLYTKLGGNDVSWNYHPHLGFWQKD